MLEKLETYRTTFANQFNTDLSFWQTWLLDYTIERSPKEVLALYEDVAFELFPHSELVADYIDYCNRLLEEEKIVIRYLFMIFMGFSQLEMSNFVYVFIRTKINIAKHLRRHWHSVEVTSQPVQ